MAFRTGSTRSSLHPLSVEFAVVIAIVGGVYLWDRLTQSLTAPITRVIGSELSLGGLPLPGVVTSSLFLVGLVVTAWLYTQHRAIDPGIQYPHTDDLPLVGMGIGLPVGMVGITLFVGRLTDVSYSSLTMTYYADPAAIWPILSLIGLGLAVGIPSLLVMCHIFIQASLNRALTGEQAVIATTFLAGFLLLSHSGLSTVPDQGKLIGAILVVGGLATAVFATEHIDNRHLRLLAYLPLCLVISVIFVAAILEIGSAAEGLFTITNIGVIAVASYTYDRSRTLILPALTYSSLFIANATVVLLIEGGGVPPAMW